MGASASALEKKGVETDKGNINREIKKHNSLVKAIKSKIKEITFWIDSLLGNLQAKYDEYKQDKKDELENKAELFNLYEYISIYNEIQGEKTKNLSYYGQIKKGNADLKRFVKAIYYLKDNHLQTIADLQGKVFELAKQSKKISSDRPAQNEFNITYNRGRHYVPDFVVETDEKIYLIEVKGEDKVNDADFIAKGKVAVKYCEVVSNWAKANGRKEWRYIFIPSKEIQISSSLASLVQRFIQE